MCAPFHVLIATPDKEAVANARERLLAHDGIIETVTSCDSVDTAAAHMKASASDYLVVVVDLPGDRDTWAALIGRVLDAAPDSGVLALCQGLTPADAALAIDAGARHAVPKEEVLDPKANGRLAEAAVQVAAAMRIARGRRKAALREVIDRRDRDIQHARRLSGAMEARLSVVGCSDGG